MAVLQIIMCQVVRERDWSNLYVRLYSETEKESNTQTVSAKNRSLEMS